MIKKISTKHNPISFWFFCNSTSVFQIKNNIFNIKFTYCYVFIYIDVCF